MKNKNIAIISFIVLVFLIGLAYGLLYTPLKDKYGSKDYLYKISYNQVHFTGDIRFYRKTIFIESGLIDMSFHKQDTLEEYQYLSNENNHYHLHKSGYGIIYLEPFEKDAPQIWIRKIKD